MRKVYLVGAGPGDPGLLTCKAFELPRKAEVRSVANPNALLLAHASETKTVIRLNGGGLMDFAPGISSSLAVPALCGIPVVATSFAVIGRHRQNLIRAGGQAPASEKAAIHVGH